MPHSYPLTSDIILFSDERAQLEKITSKALASLEQNGASKTYVQQD